MRHWLRSLEGQLVLRLSVIFAIAIVAIGVTVAVQAYWTASEIGDEALAHAFLGEFVTDFAWMLPLFALATIAIAVWTIRRGVRPVRLASALAMQITPGRTDLRLPVEDVPSEIIPLVAAVNDALDRLERGFAAQRQFTARAAHELRTPLAILSAGLENLPSSPEVDKLRSDSQRMNRLVAQLLHVARMDALPLDVGANVDLVRVAAGTVEYLAPWAVERGRSVALEAEVQSVLVKGNYDALAEALRNLVENAVTYAPPGTEVTVGVGASGTISVTDHGPGVRPADRERIFEQFWRGPSAADKSNGAGLGLAIVAEIVKAHGATVIVEDAQGGGARFVIGNLRAVD